MTKKNKVTLILPKTCEICDNYDKHRLFSVECKVWVKEIPMTLNCKSFELNKKRAKKKLELYKSYSDLKDFEIKLE